MFSLWVTLEQFSEIGRRISENILGLTPLEQLIKFVDFFAD